MPRAERATAPTPKAEPAPVPPTREAPAGGAVLTSNLRAGLIPASIILSVLLYYGFHVPLWIVGVAVALPLMTLFLAIPSLTRRSLARLDRDLVARLASGKRAELMPAFRSAWIPRLFANPALLAERLGLIHAQLGQPKEARTAYESASNGWGGYPPVSVTLGLANACYALGDDEAADPLYRELLKGGHRLPVVFHNLAHGLVRRAAALTGGGRPKMLKDAIALVQEGIPVGRGSQHETPLQLTLAEAHAALGDKKEARAILEDLEVSGELAERRAAIRAKI